MLVSMLSAFFTVIIVFMFILQGTDLSPVTDKLWKRFYEMEFGVDNAKMIIERMNRKQVQFTWKRLYEVICLSNSSCKFESIAKAKRNGKDQ